MSKSLPTIDNLTPEQQAVARGFGEGMAVLAGAGAGKTTTLVVKCAELLRQNPQARIAAVSFTEKSANDIREKLTRQLLELKPENPLAGHWVTTIHGLCRNILTEFPEEADLPGTLDMLNDRQAQWEWSESVRSLWLKRREGECPELERDLTYLSQIKAHDFVVRALSDFRKIHRFYPDFADELLARPGTDLVAKAIIRLTREALLRYEERKERLGGLDFEDLELKAFRALENPSVRRSLRARFDLFLVDEFQDTNPIQAAIVERVARPDFSNLCVIGDPKQSIYRFRDADVSVFQKFCARMPKQLKLSKNFRSHPAVLEEINAVCGQVFADSPVAYEPLIPGLSPSDGDDPKVALWRVPDHAAFAAWIKSLADRGERLEDMVLLMRQVRAKGAKWLQALARAGVPVAIGGSGRFWEDPRSLELYSFLRAWFAVGEKLPWIEVLRSPWIAVPDQEIDAWIHEDLKSRFLASTHPLAQWLSPLATQGNWIRPGEILLRLLEWPGFSPEMQGPCLALWHQVEELSLKGLSDTEVLAELARAIAEKHGDGDIPPPRSSGQLRVLTVHASKGLEFPHVILVDFEPSPRRNNARDFYLDGQEGVFFLPLDEEGIKDKSGELAQAWINRETAAEVEESKRVFYVALTRAMRQLSFVFLDLPEKKAGAKEKDPPPAFSVDHWRRWMEEALVARLPIFESPGEIPAVFGSGKDEFDGGNLPAVNAIYDLTRRRLEPRPRSRARYGVSELVNLSQCERRYGADFAGLAAAEEDLGLQLFDAAYPITAEATVKTQAVTAAEFGTQIHRVLELAAANASAASAAELRARQDRLDTDFSNLARLQKRSGFSVDLDALRDWVEQDAAQNSAEREIYSELAFEFFAGAAVVGKIDRLELGKDRAKIVDFKVTTRLKTAEEMIAQYRLQLGIYALAVRKLLGGVSAEVPLDLEIVQISPQGVRTIRLPDTATSDAELRNIENEIKKWVARSGEILNQPALTLRETVGSGCQSCIRQRRCVSYQSQRDFPPGPK